MSTKIPRGQSWEGRIKLVESILTPRKRFLDRIAVLGDNILGCGNGQLYFRKLGQWVKGYPGGRGITGDENLHVRDVTVNGNKVIVYTVDKGADGQLFVHDTKNNSHTTLNLFLGIESSTVLAGQRDGVELYYISDQFEAVVHQFNGRGQLIRDFGAEILRYPCDMAEDVRGDLIVCDWLLNDVIIFDENGRVKRRLSHNNNFPPKQPFFPYGVTVDQKGFIFVSCWRTSEILLFSPQGDLLQCVLTAADGLDGPLDITTTTDGRLLAVNAHGTQIRCYKYHVTGGCRQ